jgi:cation diffusion facilitator family transporter
MASESYSKNGNHEISIITDINEAYENKTKASTAAVWRALIANIGIAVIKFISWTFSFSSTMLAESIHSAADSFNSLCLLIGLKRGSKPADMLHPYGYGLEANIWALFACILMLGGTAVSLYSGFNRFFYGHGETVELLEHYNLVAVTLVVSILFEMWAVLSASIAVVEEAEVKVKNRIDAFLKSFKYIKIIKSPTTKFVWYEDTAALIGVTVALIALTISKYFVSENMAHIPDAIASLIIGIILFALAVYLLKHNINTLTGAGAGPQIEEMIKDIAEGVHGVSQLHDLKTMDMGPSGLIVTLKIEVDPETQVKDADNIAERVEDKIREKVKEISHVSIEIQARDIEEDWAETFQKHINEGKETGILKPYEAKMLSKFFDFTDTVVHEIMVPRTEVVFVAADSDIKYLIELIINSGHTRIPLYKDNIDNIIGVINAKDVLRAVKENNGNNLGLESLAREIPLVPENKSISDMLKDFTSKKTQIAAVIDEHGGVAGIVTIEDILEEIVGEIYDEFDIVQTPEIVKLDEKTLDVASKISIYDLNDRFDLDLPTEDFQTVGGYVFGLLGREPEEGDEVEDNNIKFVVKNMDGHKIVRVSMYKEDGFIDEQALEDEV